MQHRREKLWGQLSVHEVDAYLTFSPENRRYMTGFSGSSGYVLITRDETILLTDSRYAEQAKQEAKESNVILHGVHWMTSLRELMQEKHVLRLGFEPNTVSYKVYQELVRELEGVTLLALDRMIDDVRMIKEATELKVMSVAAQIADAAFEHVCQNIRVGMTEREVALSLFVFMQNQGASGVSFETIVASGERSSMPHGVASDRILQKGDLITLDFGALYEGYASDITRTIALGAVNDQQREIYSVVYQAQTTALAGIRAGMTGREADAIARDLIRAAGYGEYFGHSLGHGLGLAVHEAPRLAQQSQDVLQEGMVVTVEPGVYLPGFGGVRIEDDIVVTENGPHRLTQSTKELLVL
ncbi:M24 family metallopeptidase [Sulfoacidibacillus thermotolerans]|uniref:Xaa-Pro dipeptidase n=1 Tax=Sulfoacidibacillus thermotolerans TaxID=1765684 RepID=A0A2U3DBY3_SULT2|nr:aminopeptidase P family protein [Sulfoacidibacillus thermotolerans]PWI58797.1 Xaa-Pro dipeptidase [Sulfoacidibacillus thermotolerans]